MNTHTLKWKSTNLQTRLYLIAVIVLLVGLGSALVIYLTAGNDSDSVVGYTIEGGNVYQIMPENSKMYKHDLELYGGKANVLADDLRQWFVGLWHGKSLAFTVAFISIVISFGFFFVARHLQSDLQSDAGDEDNRVK